MDQGTRGAYTELHLVSQTHLSQVEPKHKHRSSLEPTLLLQPNRSFNFQPTARTRSWAWMAMGDVVVVDDQGQRLGVQGFKLVGFTASGF